MSNEISKPTVRINGQVVLTPEEVRELISERVGAEFSIKQVERLGDRKLLPPVLYKRLRFYPKKDVEKLLKKDVIVLSPSNPNRARLRRGVYQDRSLR